MAGSTLSAYLTAMAEDVSVVREALLTILSPAVSSAARFAATQYVENFKASSQQCENIGFTFLLDCQADLQVRIFGVQLLEHCITTRWNSYSADAKNSFKSAVLEKVLFCTASLDGGSSAIKHKVASLFSQLVKREWPQQWPSFLESLLSASKQDEAHCEFVLTILKAVVEDVMEFDTDLPTDRKRELRLSLTECLPVVLDLVALTIDNSLPNVQQSIVSSTTLCLAAVEFLFSLVGWIPLDLLFSRAYLSRLTSMLSIPALRAPACECLALVYERKGTKDDRQPLLEIMQFSGSLVGSLPNPHAPLSDEAVRFTQCLADVVYGIGIHQISSFWSPTLAHLPVFAAALMDMTTHPSLRLVNSVLVVWTHLLRQSSIEESCLPAHFAQLMQGCVLRLQKPRYGGSADSAAVYLQRDFSTRSEFNAFFAIFRNTVLVLVRAVSTLAPLECTQFAVQCLGVVFQPVFDGSFQPGSSDGFRSVVMFTECVFDGVVPYILSKKDGDRTRTEILSTLHGCLQGLVALSSPHIVVLMSRLALLRSIFPLLAVFDGELPVVLECIFSGLETSDAPGSSLPQQVENMKLRKAAGCALISLCQKPPPSLISYLDLLVIRTRKDLTNPDTPESNKRTMLEALLAAGNLIPAYEMHCSYLSQLLDSALTVLVSPGSTASLANELVFAEAACLIVLEKDSAGFRPRLTQGCFALAAASKITNPRSQAGSTTTATSRMSGAGGCWQGGDGNRYPYVQQLTALLPTVLSLVRCVHCLWARPPATMSPPLLEMRAVDVDILLGNHDDEGSAPDSSDGKLLDGARLWLGGLRENCYTLLGAACKTGLAYDPSHAAQILCVEMLPSMHVRHKRLFVKHVLANFVLHCPREPARLLGLQEPLLSVYSHFLALLARLWEVRRARGSCVELCGNESGHLDADTRDTLLGKQLDELAHDLLTHVFSIYSNAQPSSEAESHPAHQLGPTGLFFLASPLSEPTLSLCAEALVSPNASTSRMATDFALSILPLLCGESRLQGYVLGMLLRCTMLGLSVNGQHSDCETNLLNILRCSPYHPTQHHL